MQTDSFAGLYAAKTDEELLELAADIRARRFLERLQRLNLMPVSSDQERFKQELEGL